jgi:sulfate adenylyltransferase subunit 2
MIWLAPQAFGRVPFPALHVDTGKKFPEMRRVPRSLWQGVELDLRVEPCPPIDSVDPDLAACRPLRRAQDRRIEARAQQIRL